MSRLIKTVTAFCPADVPKLHPVGVVPPWTEPVKSVATEVTLEFFGPADSTVCVSIAVNVHILSPSHADPRFASFWAHTSTVAAEASARSFLQLSDKWQLMSQKVMWSPEPNPPQKTSPHRAGVA